MNALIIARFTMREAVRRRLLLAGVLMSVLFIGLYGIGFNYLFEREGGNSLNNAQTSVAFAAGTAVLVLLGIYAVHMLASFLALFLGVASVSSEVESGTLHAILARPLSRADYLAGRWLAFVVIIAIYVSIMVSAMLLVANAVSGYEAPEPGRAILMMVLSATLLCTMSLAGSTVFPTLANGVIVFSLFGLAWLAGIIEFIGVMAGQTGMVNIGIGVSLLVPSDALWRGASYYLESPAARAILSSGNAPPFVAISPPTAPLIIWAAAHVLVTLAAGIWALNRRDL